MIKKIHYCWFGGKKLPKDVKKCIATWKKWLPDYEIIEWNEDKFDVNSNPFVKKAYENKKWAFVSDYVRTYALYEQGGLYLDTDVKILKDVSKIIDNKLVLGYEDSGYFGTALIATNQKNSPYIKEVMNFYNNIEDFNVDIIYNYANPAIITRIINKYDVEQKENGVKIFNKEVCVYPRDYFYPLSYNYSEKEFTKNTCAVHLFNGTWTDKGEQRTIKLYRKFGLSFGGFLNKTINNIFGIKSGIKKSIFGIYKFARMKYSIHFNIKKRVNRVRESLNNYKEDYLIICDPDVKEIKDIVYNNFKENILELREQHTKKEAELIAKEILNSKKNTIIFNSYSKGWENIIKTIKKQNAKIKIKNIIYHNNSFLSNPYYSEITKTLVDLYFKGLIDEFGFMNENNYNFYKQKGYKSKLIYNCIEINNKNEYKKSANSDKIGMYYEGEGFEKNIYNQISAISLIENPRLDCIPLNYKISDLCSKLNVTLFGNKSMCSKEELYKKIVDCNIILNITFSNNIEILPIESLELGVPCLVGNCTSYFKDSELEKYLVVNEADNIIEINQKIDYVLDNKAEILKIYKNWKEQYDEKSKNSIKEFLNN